MDTIPELLRQRAELGSRLKLTLQQNKTTHENGKK